MVDSEIMDQEMQDQEIEIEAIGIEVSSQPIELYKVFKIANLVSAGGEAKHLIAEGYVAVNGELETRKRRKLYDGDLLEFNQEYYLIICDAPITEPVTKDHKASLDNSASANQSKANQPKAKKSQQEQKSQKDKSSQQQASSNQESKTPKGRGRSSIDFF